MVPGWQVARRWGCMSSGQMGDSMQARGGCHESRSAPRVPVTQLWFLRYPGMLSGLSLAASLPCRAAQGLPGAL